MVHLLHRLYGVDAPDYRNYSVAFAAMDFVLQTARVDVALRHVHVLAGGVASFNRTDVTVPRSVRKTIFGLRLWQPARPRFHSQRFLRAVPGRPALHRIS